MKVSTDQQQLLIAMRNGSEAAFTALYELHWQNLFTYVMKVVKDEDETADIIQDIFLNLWLSRDKVHRIEDLDAYLFIMARNTSLQRLAAKSKNNKLVERLQCYLAGTHQTETDKMMFGKELKEIVDKAIAQLPNKMREVFVLSREEDLSHREIANRLSISDKTVKKQVSYAIRIIRACIKAKIPILVCTLLLFI
ncbi:RNA polymerase sigma-70 factor [Olivibacter sp. SDN3]|uniref:RNA polymerase sigma factor n=1 Tax=Olivibacter sp. SDN3 TaxID=2764720 RepID=UPI0016515FA5|nr:RNA polymerase sigma-70 factor [Olivibacter sp. SDN3]QNL51909.1 RNA polymerase sigma-70 factor [Olivibacter sp. SDN3]